MGSWPLYRQTGTAVYSRESSYTDRGKASQFMMTGGGCLPFSKDKYSLICIYGGLLDHSLVAITC